MFPLVEENISIRSTFLQRVKGFHISNPQYKLSMCIFKHFNVLCFIRQKSFTDGHYKESNLNQEQL